MSKQRKLRNKLSFNEDEEGADNPPPPPPAASKSQSKPKKTVLSFGEDEEELIIAPYKSKKDKSKVSKFHRANVAAPAAPAPAPAVNRPAAGEYTAEKLAALQAATQKLPSKLKAPPAAAAAATDAAAAGGIKLSGSFKPAAKPKDDRFSYNYSITGQITSSTDKIKAAGGTASGGAGGAAVNKAAAAAAAGDGDDGDDAMPLPPPPRPGGSSRAAAAAAGGGEGAGSDEDADDEDADGFSMPDKEMIRLAKAKRERLRQAHLAPDYLPLGGAGRLLGTGAAAAALPGSSSRGLGLKSGAGAGVLADEDGEGVEGLAGSGSDREGSGASDDDAELEERMRMAFVGQQRGSSAAAAGSSRRGGSSKRSGKSTGAAAAAAAVAGGQYMTTVQDDHEEEDDDDIVMTDVAAAGNGSSGQQQQLAKAIRRNAAGSKKGLGSSSNWGLGVGRAAGRGVGAGDRSEAVAAAGAGVLAALLEASSRASERQKHLEANLKRTTTNLTGALEEVERVRADIATTGDKYSAVQALKAYLADLADCLAAKAPLVEELQDSLDTAREEAAAATRQQLQDDERILFAQAEAAVTEALAVLGRGGAASAAAAAAANAAAEAEEGAVAAAAAAGSSRDANVDEFGRDLGLMRRKELEKGKGRRSGIVAVLLQQLQQLRQGGRLDLEDSSDPWQQQPAAAAGGTGSTPGSSSTAAAVQEPEVVQQYKRRRQEILDLSPTVFADTDEQYASLTSVKARLEGFKAQYPNEYSKAYLGDSAAALFAPFVRLELLQWEPLPMTSLMSFSSSSSNGDANGQQQQQVPAGFDTQEWYQQLFEYGLGAGSTAAAAAADDADANLVPQLVESLVLPIALQLVARCWDPCQVAQSRAIVSLVSDLFVYVPADKEDMAQLLALTTGSLEAAAAAAVVPPWPAAAAAASPIAQAVLQLRFWRAAALLRGLLGFKELLNQQLMYKLALQGLVAQQLVPCLRSSMGHLGMAVARAEAVVQSLPGSWFKEGLAPREAQSLLDVLASLARSIEQQQQQQQQQGAPGGVDGESPAVSGPMLAALGRRVSSLLLHVGLREQAQRLGQVLGTG